MKTEDRVLAALRARFWLHLWYRHILHLSEVLPDLYSLARSFISSTSFQILNRLCDILVLLVLLTFSRYYPTIPFCIWLFGTELVEHFFGNYSPISLTQSSSKWFNASSSLAFSRSSENADPLRVIYSTVVVTPARPFLV